jgi:hypothetical protein
MKGSDKAVVLGVVIALILGVFYLKVLSPKRDEAASLKKSIADLQGQVDTQRAAADAGEAARQNYPVYYGRLVSMGKAAPAGADTSSLLVQLNHVSDKTHVSFDKIELDASSGTTASATASTTPPPTTSTGTTSTSTSTTPSGSGSSGSATAASSTTTPTPGTEATAANLPIGATVGQAGMPVMPYKLRFGGSFFDVENFLTGVDGFVHVNGTNTVAADGRLLTVDGFSINGVSPTLDVTLHVTSYVVPDNEGLTAGASPGGPAPVQTQPVSSTVSP